MSATSIATIPIYVRIPVALRDRIDEAAKHGMSYLRRGAVGDTIIKALEESFPVGGRKADTDQMDLWDEQPDEIKVLKPITAKARARARARAKRKPKQARKVARKGSRK